MRAVRTLLTLLIGGNVLVLLSAVLVRVNGQNPAYLDVPLTVVFGPQPYLLQQGNPQLRPSEVEVALTDPTLGQTLLGLLAHGLPLALAVLPMLIFARRLVDHATDHGPFTGQTAGGLRRLGHVVLAGGLLAELVRSAAALLLYRSAVPGGHPFTDADWLIGFWWLVLGLVILAFAQIIRYGCDLRAELDGVV